MNPKPGTQRPRSQALQERSRRTSDQLITIALELFAARGFDEVTVDEICAGAGIAKGTFYFHFPSKQALLVAAFHRGGTNIQMQVEQLLAVETPFVEAVLALGNRIATTTGRLPKPLVHKATIEALAAIGSEDRDGERRRRREAVIALVRAGQASGEVRGGLHAAEVAMTLNWAILQAILVWSSTTTTKANLGRLMRRRLLIALYGIASNVAGNAANEESPFR